MITREEIKRIRTRHDITLLELAAQTGLPEKHLANLEAGDYTPLESDLLRIEKALNAIVKALKEDHSGSVSGLSEEGSL